MQDPPWARYGTQREWCENDVLKTIRRRSLAKLRKEAEPVDQPVLARLFTHWQGVTRKRRGLDALLEVVETLQGFPMAASIFESDILTARIADYKSSDLDTLSAAGEIVWVGVEPLGERDGRIALYLTDHLPLLYRSSGSSEFLGVPRSDAEAKPKGTPGDPRDPRNPRNPRNRGTPRNRGAAEGPPRNGTANEEVLPGQDARVLEHLRSQGASFFNVIQGAVGGFPAELVDALWDLVWKGLITNDTFHALRAYTRPKQPRSTGFRSRRVAPASTQGRWSLVPTGSASDTQRATALAQQFLSRYGVVTREAPALENVYGGFSAVYPVLKGMEDAGRIRRGYFVAGLGATQFASGGAIDLLRSLRDEPETPETVMLAATDPANPYGAIVKWPESPWSLSRSVGSEVILVNGIMACYVSRGEKQFYVFLPEAEPTRSMVAREVAKALAALVKEGSRRALLINEVNEEPASKSVLAPFLAEEGFVATAMGMQLRQTESSRPRAGGSRREES